MHARYGSGQIFVIVAADAALVANLDQAGKIDFAARNHYLALHHLASSHRDDLESKKSMKAAPDYLNPDIPAGLRRCCIPVVDATAETLDGYGYLVSDPQNATVEIVRWPAQGWRPVDIDCGDEGGTTEGIFISEWKGDVLHLHWIEVNLDRSGRYPTLTPNEKRFKRSVDSGNVVNHYHHTWVDGNGEQQWESRP